VIPQGHTEGLTQALVTLSQAEREEENQDELTLMNQEVLQERSFTLACWDEKIAFVSGVDMRP